MSCCVPGCGTKYREKGVNFHEIPVGEFIRAKWLTILQPMLAIKFGSDSPWLLSDATVVCSRHFREADYVVGEKKKFLLKDAVPCLFPANLIPLIQKKRNLDRLQKSTILCPSCDFKSTTHDGLRTHIRTHHDVALECDELIFSTLADFLEWKSEQEKKSHSTYTKTSASRTLSGEETKSFYFCHRAGYFKSKSSTSRAMKRQGSCKIGSTCPSSMIVVESPARSKHPVINVSFWKTHFGHTASVAHLPCTWEQRTALADKTAEGGSLDRILDGIDSGNKAEDDQVCSEHLHDLRSIRKDFSPIKAFVNVKQEPAEEILSASAGEEDEELAAEYPVESVYVKGEPPDEISSTQHESDDEVQAISDVNPIEENESDQAEKESPDEPSAGRRFIFDPVLGSYRQTNCPSPPAVLVEEDPLSLKHVKKAPKKQKRPDNSVRPFKCLQCVKSYPYRYLLRMHVLTHTEERPFGCAVCDKKFKFGNDLTMHMVVHSGERPFHCDRCDKTFVRRGELRMHKFTHTGETRFSCEQCEKKFLRRIDLKTHTYSHTGERRLGCQQCDKKFMRHADLRSHVYTHTGERPFCCEICKRKFTRSGELKVHVRTHSDHYKCRACEKTFASDRNLKRHFKTAHAGEGVVPKGPSALVAVDDALADRGPPGAVT